MRTVSADKSFINLIFILGKITEFHCQRGMVTELLLNPALDSWKICVNFVLRKSQME